MTELVDLAKALSVAFFVDGDEGANEAVSCTIEIEVPSENWKLWRLDYTVNGIEVTAHGPFTARRTRFERLAPGIYGVAGEGPITYEVPDCVRVYLKGGKDPWPVPPPPPPKRMASPFPTPAQYYAAGKLPVHFLRVGGAGGGAAGFRATVVAAAWETVAVQAKE